MPREKEEIQGRGDAKERRKEGRRKGREEGTREGRKERKKGGRNIPARSSSFGAVEPERKEGTNPFPTSELPAAAADNRSSWVGS